MTHDAREVAEAYCQVINSGDLHAVLALFAKDAVMLHPSGRFDTLDAIRTFYESTVLAFSTRLEVVSWVSEGQTCVFEVEATSPRSDKTTFAIDHLTTDGAGKISRLAVYYR